MIRVDFQFYVEEYNGIIIEDERSLKQPILKANTYLNQIMHLQPTEDEMELVKLCLCELSDMIYQDDMNRMEHGGREVQSENTDGYSVNYATEAEAGKIAVDALQTKIYAVIRRYLAHTGLLYLGGECQCLRMLRLRYSISGQTGRAGRWCLFLMSSIRSGFTRTRKAP